jgi:hypothetical protein
MFQLIVDIVWAFHVCSVEGAMAEIRNMLSILEGIDTGPPNSQRAS